MAIVTATTDDSDMQTTLVQPTDCREALPLLADQSVSLVLTDPPYFLDGMGEDWDHQNLKKRVSSGVVGGIPAGQKFDQRQGINLQNFLAPIAVELLRILKPGGFLLCFSQPRLVHRTAMSIELAGFEIRDILAWQREGQGKAFSQHHFVQKRTDLSATQKQQIIQKLGDRKTPQLRSQMELIVLAQAPRETTYWETWIEHQTGLVDLSNPVISSNGSSPGTIIACPKPRARHNHMTVKPVELCRHLIRMFSAPNALVVDPFSGCGTTGVAALLEGREFKGYEICSDMAAIANKRINQKTRYVQRTTDRY